MCLSHGPVLHPHHPQAVILDKSHTTHVKLCGSQAGHSPAGTASTHEMQVRAGCVRMTGHVSGTNKAGQYGIHDQPCPISPFLPPGAIFGYLSALVRAKPQSPEPSFLHGQLLKAGSKAGTASSFQVAFQGQGLWLKHSLPSKRPRQKGTVLKECSSAHSVVLTPAKVAHCLPACCHLPVTASSASVTATGHPLLAAYPLLYGGICNALTLASWPLALWPKSSVLRK